MSKKKTTTKPDATRPSVIPIMRSKGSKAKAKAKSDDELATPAVTETPPIEETAPTSPPEQAPTHATETASVEGATPTATPDQEATPSPETPASPADNAGQTATPATAAPTDDAGATKKKRKAKVTTEPKPKKVSCLDAAAQVLAESGTAMTTGEMIEAMAQKKLWSSPNGQTPSATLYSSILREINTKDTASRFTKTERGKFSAKA